ncbi:type IX secretion system membrane protein PorP/SprF [Salmonella enterica subsp. enterica serovar Oranienburg]|uniref:Type IX secretion system membrane protein PorP/SprF n=1 Tax=Salmonella oranienberg TaxID=28147 RepID=A0A5H6R5M3_SALON|nr:conjugal transfer protein TraF [Salmonella enterica]EBD5946312.1 type IX secretion system membrane protein PorP/SprF [Salmonella enterica subsp. enterica serovar Roodepoort]EBP3756039.1 conjugal transfer protein TraF [Salmonella enterica subsp. enterica]EBQ8957522.1 type IX secretion system membrane protein PorP/SprF [Salmonella enterica subsp. enterica serovar Oranienburg]ECM7512201.1 conjugal transfer protein TraF [Salmonella enterica subsp. enterica serovar Montevideo]EDR1018295.1 conjug
MMKKNQITRTLIASAVLFAFNASAATSYFEARNDAMGGTGVASSHYGVAPLANPALLTKHDSSDDISLLLPSVGAQLSDPDDISNKADDVKADWDAFDRAVDSNYGVKQAAGNLKRRLQEFRNIHADAQAGVSAVAAMPNDTLPFALMIKSYGTANVDGKVSDADLDYLEKVANGTITNVDKNALTSRAYGRAAVISDIGISFAKELETAGQKWSLGLTPKYQRVDLFNYNVTVQDYDKNDFDSDQYHSTKNGFNADIGAYTDLNSNWTVGLVVQNIVPRSIDSKEVNGVAETFKIRPQATTGVSWHNSLFTTALDVDLTPASGFTSDNKRQFASVGAEFNAWKWAQLRAGYRQNMASDSGSAFTAGVGISPFDVVHLDVSGLIGTDHDYGAIAQLQFTF